MNLYFVQDMYAIAKREGISPMDAFRKVMEVFNAS